jgi:hypothetical protein
MSGFANNTTPATAQPISGPSNQRIITVDSTVPESEKSFVALDENALADHLERFLQAEDNKSKTFVFSAVFGGPHLYCFPPSEKLNRPFWTIVTMGMSGTEMKVPRDIGPDWKDYERAELMCYLPADWNFPKSLGTGEELDENNWPMEMLRSFVRYVVSSRNWVSHSHGLPNIMSNPAGQPFVPSTRLSHVILLEPNEPEEFCCCSVQDKKVQFLLVIPVTAAEAAWKREVGIESSLYYCIGSKAIGGDAIMVDYVIDPLRPCAVEDLGAREVFAEGEHDEDNDEDDNDGNKDDDHAADSPEAADMEGGEEGDESSI